MAKTGRYRIINTVGWSMLLIGLGLFTSLQISTNIGLIVFYQLIIGVGLGLVFVTTFIVLAPLPITENASALAFLTFVRTFAQAWGVAITGTILQNRLKSDLPLSVLSQFPEGADLTYGVIPLIPTMMEPLRSEVSSAFLHSMRTVWIVMVALCGMGFLSSILVKDITLGNSTDKKWGLKPKKQQTETSPQHV